MQANATPSLTFPIESVALDADAQSCWELAAWIGMLSSDDHLVSFTSLLIALLHFDHPLSTWALRYARAARINISAIHATRQFRASLLTTFQERRGKGEVPSGKPAFTTSAKNMAEAAQDLVSATGGSQLGLRHLLGAYLYKSPSAHEQQLEEWGFDRQRDGSAFVRQMHQRYPSEASRWEQVHSQARSEAPDLKARDPWLLHVSGFAADTAAGEDYLDIEDDVYALSALICSTKVSPPLSVGLFGDWGSGKSFFMHQLQRGVSWISQEARESDRMQKDLPFYKSVVQIEFNAWNYSGGNLWAALVQHILEHLRLSDKEPTDLVSQRRNDLKDKMRLVKEVRDAAVVRQKAAKDKVRHLKNELTSLRQKHAADIERLKKTLAMDVLKTLKLDPESSAQLNQIREDVQLPPAAANAGEFLAAVEATRSLLSRASALFLYVPKSQRLSFIVVSALVLFGPPVVAVSAGLILSTFAPQLGTLTAFVSWVATSLLGGTAWLQQRLGVLAKPLARLEALQAHARQRVQAEQQKHQAEAAGLEQRISLARDELLAAQAKQQDAVMELQQIEAQLKATTPASVLADFVSARARSEDYRPYLGLPAIIREDFENISRLVTQENAELATMTSLAQEKIDANRRISRIVLYIDDLDRCPETLVVEVLQAVHLLLAFPLFVVVVAVDARWLARSLSQYFPGLLSAGSSGNLAPANGVKTGHATPSDYLEKIFQIPFWIRSPADGAVKRMLHGLIGESLAVPARTAGEPSPHSNGATVPESGLTQVFTHRQHDPDAASLEIQTEELQYMDRLAPLLGRSPRALKRFVNVYRLLKASLPPEQLDCFLEDQSPGGASYKRVLFLLALVNGLPAVSDALLTQLNSMRDEGADDAAGPATLESALAWLPKDSDEIRAQAATLSAWLKAEPQGWENTSPNQLRPWVANVARYCYHLHRV
jgi:hypothetical protein